MRKASHSPRLPRMAPQSAYLPGEKGSTLSLLFCMWGYLNRRRRLQLGLLLMVMLATAGAEFISLGAVLPFLAVLSEPERLWQQPLVQSLSLRLGLIGPDQLLLPATTVFTVALILAAIVRLTNLWLNGMMAAAIGSDLSGEVYRRTLYQPYGVHVQRNSSTVLNTITNEVQHSVWAFKSIFQFATSALVACALFGGLLLVGWKLTLGVIFLFGSSYVLIALMSRRRLTWNSNQITSANGQLVKAVQEGLGAIRDVLLNNYQLYYVEIYLNADRRQRILTAVNDFLAEFPRYAVESLGMVAIALLGYFLVVQKGGEGSAISILGFLALGAQRLLPALQSVFRSWAQVNGFSADLAGVIEMLDQPLPATLSAESVMELKQSIQLQRVSFRYSAQKPDVLNRIDLEIRRGERIGLVGTTGSGKSTMVDLVMGLLVPTAGRLLVDGLDLHDPLKPERLLEWRASISHVPQSIYLADSSFAENIALGIPRERINMDQVRNAARQAQISSFIDSTTDGYNSFVGERGIRLSGGQRQRIGIARALYKQASLLILDEATSALDTETESAVMEVVDTLSHDLTVVIIAHRLSTVRNCDRIISLDKGNLLE
jgi:ABC-type multidrug transport system fused ATPase/permease subunit